MAAVDVAFPVGSAQVPRDHGYALFSAICRRVPSAHGGQWLGVHPLSGQVVDDKLVLSSDAHLRLRVAAERIPEILPLSGQTLEVAAASLRLGIPRVYPLAPAPTLDARLVVVKLTNVPRKPGDGGARGSLDVGAVSARVQEELERQLTRIGVTGKLALVGRQRITVSGKRVLGYSVRVSELSAEHSLRLQEAGLGGKRGMGCGLFRPTRG